MLIFPRIQASLRGRREGRVVCHWAENQYGFRAVREFDTPHADLQLRTDTWGEQAPDTSVQCDHIILIRRHKMKPEKKIVAGIDVGKHRLDASISGATAKGFDNTAGGIARLLRWLRAGGVTRAVFEASGGYERGLLQALLATDIEACQAHPPRARAFARAAGIGAKTDSWDARMLCAYGEQMALPAVVAVDPEVQHLRGLTERRRQLVDQRIQELNRVEKRPSLLAVRSCRRHIEWLNREITAIDKAIAQALSSGKLAERAALLQSIKGIGQVSAAALLGHLPELGEGSGHTLTSLVGLAPWARDSGQYHGKRSIRGGRGAARQALYMPALSAIRYDRDMRRFYQGLCKRGKPGKVALVAVMRKMLLLSHAIIRRGTPWVENYPSAPLKT